VPLHRRVTVSGFSADPYWSRTQAKPSPALFVETIRASKCTQLCWWGVGYDGDDANASPVDSTGITFNAAIVIARPNGRLHEYVRLTSIAEELSASIEAGRVKTEVDIPDGFEAWICMIALAVGGSPATHLWLSYEVR
jgi:hypothetical protein